MGSDIGKARVGNHVCVVGTGPVGLVALKNLAEQGLRVTALERNDYVGGNWHAADDPGQVSVLPSTEANVSKQLSSFTDFPMPDSKTVSVSVGQGPTPILMDQFIDNPTFPVAKNLQNYLEAYAQNFSLLQHVKFCTTVTNIQRYEKYNCWLVYSKNTKTNREEIERFDRVVIATGMLNAKNQPNIRGIENFAGDTIHSREFKDPAKYAGKNVLVVGIGSTGADTLCSLKKAGAKRLYLSHRGQFCVLPRMVCGRAFDHNITRRINILIRFISSLAPSFASFLMSKAMQTIQRAAFPFLRSHPSFLPPRTLGSLVHRFPFFSDDLPYYLRNGDVETVPGIDEVVGPCSVAFKNGTKIRDLDAIIFCSGYYYDFSLVQGPGCPADPAFAPDRFERLEKAQFRNPDECFPRLYHGVLSERYPESLAVLGHLLVMKPVFMLNDLATMALASLWSENYPLPSSEEMRLDIDAHYDFVVRMLEQGPVPHMGLRINYKKTYEWMNRVAGTGVNERLGSWGWEGWKFWWRNRRLYHVVMDGPDVPAVYRLFDAGRGRKPWEGAKDYIEKVNKGVGVTVSTERIDNQLSR